MGGESVREGDGRGVVGWVGVVEKSEGGGGGGSVDGGRGAGLQHPTLGMDITQHADPDGQPVKL